MFLGNIIEGKVFLCYFGGLDNLKCNFLWPFTLYLTMCLAGTRVRVGLHILSTRTKILRPVSSLISWSFLSEASIVNTDSSAKKCGYGLAFERPNLWILLSHDDYTAPSTASFRTKLKTIMPLALVYNPTLRVIGLQIPFMERPGVAVDALQLFLRLKY